MPDQALPEQSHPWQLLPALLYVVLIFVAGGVNWSGAGGMELPAGIPPDKLFHALGFAGLVPVLNWGLAGIALPSTRRRRVWVAVLGSTLAGALLELYQTALPHRSAEWLDLVADAVGALLAGVCLWFLRRS